MQNGKAVNAYHMQPITLVVSNDKDNAPMKKKLVADEVTKKQ